jgi:hypothetical protein
MINFSPSEASPRGVCAFPHRKEYLRTPLCEASPGGQGVFPEKKAAACERTSVFLVHELRWLGSLVTM